jgi:hypothetical protein
MNPAALESLEREARESLGGLDMDPDVENAVDGLALAEATPVRRQRVREGSVSTSATSILESFRQLLLSRRREEDVQD